MHKGVFRLILPAGQVFPADPAGGGWGFTRPLPHLHERENRAKPGWIEK